MKKKTQIPVFKAEKEAGIASLVQSNASIAYLSKVEDVKLSQEVLANFLKTSASEEIDKQFDLFYLNTILVTTGWNKNDDVFDKVTTWSARYTPVHKQFNLEHDQSKIIGHMTSAQAVDENFELIPDDISIDNLPAKFHILTGAVIYRALADAKAQEEIEKIIEEIGRGEWFVSMECLFRNFDYAITSASGEQRILPRTEETAFLTKHLRAYKGSGKYEDFSVGRCLKDITFSGKGLVRNPANPESKIILDNSTAIFNASYANLGYITSSNHNSNKNENQESVSMANENTEDKDRLAQANQKITDLEKQLSDKATLLSTAVESGAAKDKTIADKDKAISDLEGKVKTLETSLSESKAEVDTLKEEVNKAAKEKLVALRVATLIEKGVSEKEAKAFATLLADKTDEEFNAFAEMVKKEPASKEEKGENETPPAKTKKKAKATKEVEDSLDELEEEEDVTFGGEEDSKKVNSLRKSMAAVFAEVLQNDSDDFDFNSSDDEDEDEEDED